MNNDHRITKSPELLRLGGNDYRPESANATTFLFVGKVLATSRNFHITIINGVRHMDSVDDLETANDAAITFASPLSEQDLQEFNANWCGELGIARVRFKAGRIWQNVPDGNSGTCTVISFWGDKETIHDFHLESLRKHFQIDGQLIVEYKDLPPPSND